MDKQQLLSAITSASSAKQVSKKEVISAYEKGINRDAVHYSLSISEILYYIGGLIIFIGIGVFLNQNWEELNSLARIVVTLGSGLAAYFVGVAFLRDKRVEKIAHAFFFLSAILLPMGLAVFFTENGYEMTASIQSIMSFALFAMFLASYFLMKKDIFLLFTILFGTWFYFAILNHFMIGIPYYSNRWRLEAYQVLVAGLTYILLGYAFEQKKMEQFTSFLYGFGILGFLASALSLGGWSPDQNVFWELAFPAFVFGAIFLSIYLKAKSFLVFGSIFLMVYILKITAEYFTNSLGWPLSLIVAGFALIAVGYLAVHVNRKYMPKK